MTAIESLNPSAEYARAENAFKINLMAALGLHDVMRTNFGPKGTYKMLVSGAGQIKLTKDGNVCLQEMSIRHPTASLIARVATAQDDVTGDGTTSAVLMIAELLKQADRLIFDSGYQIHAFHPRIVTEGYELAKKHALNVLDQLRINCPDQDDVMGKDILVHLARTALETKVVSKLARTLSEDIVDAVLSVKEKGKTLDLHRVEIMQMKHKRDMDTTLIKGIVLDHGGRHPDMPKRVTNAYILVCNVSMEYEKTEINSSFFYKSAVERDILVQKEREFIDDRVRKVIALKRLVCGEKLLNGDAVHNGTDALTSFVLINQKGIDPLSLDLLARENILALRRCKRRNLERLALACGGYAVNCLDDLKADCLGKSGLVYEYTLGDDKYTFVEECQNPMSVTLLIKGPNNHTINQVKDAINDGLKAIRNCINDRCVVPGAGAVQIAAHLSLMNMKERLSGKEAYGVEAFAQALLVIPKVLAENAGHDAKDCEVKLLAEQRRRMESKLNGKTAVGLNIDTGEPMEPYGAGVFDNHCVIKQILDSSAVIASNILLVDEIMKAGLDSLK